MYAGERQLILTLNDQVRYIENFSASTRAKIANSTPGTAFLYNQQRQYLNYAFIILRLPASSLENLLL